jgi:light-regulated signal transduction histidine kinase (bacteriophytochrome)
MSREQAKRMARTVRPYALPILGFVVATEFSLIIQNTLGQHRIHRLLYLIVVLISAWWGGYGPGLLACFLGQFVSPVNFLSRDIDSIHLSRDIDPIRMLLVFCVSLLVSRTAAQRREAELNLRQINDTLNQRVQERTTELERSNGELKRLNEVLNQFAYSASHDLRGLLGTIRMSSQFLERRYQGRLDTDADAFLTSIIQGTEQMDLLLQDLLAYSRTINVSTDEAPVIDLNRVMAQVMKNLKGAIDDSAAELLTEDLPRVRVHEFHLMQLFQNLVGNALKFRNDRTPVIRIYARPEGLMWKLCITDNGIGIPPEQTERIFGLFQRLHTAQEIEGTGVGLTICRTIVERYGGRIWVESEVGQGSTFFFTVPGTHT